MRLRGYQREFDYVRRTYFPRWDLKKEWTCQVLDDVDGAQGHCEIESKTIKICYTAKNRLRPLLIHEITHAVTSDEHGRKWQARMEKAARKAEMIGEVELSAEIRKDIEYYRDPAKLRQTPAMTYQQIEDSVLENSVPVSFDQLIGEVARYLGMSVVEFLKRYKRSQRVFDVATKEWKRRRLVEDRRKQ